MSDSWQDSIVLITSNDSGESHFGTGFVIDRDEQTTYLLTCAHVVRDVGGPEKIEINGTQVEELASSPVEGADLVVLRIKRLLNIPPLPLYAAGEKGKPFSTAGFQLDGKRFLIRELHGILGEQVGVQMRGQTERIRAWDLEITDKYLLQPGYSGSPVVDEYNNVIGVINTRRGDGKTGVAISIEALRKVWQDIPSSLFKPDTYKEPNYQRATIGRQNNNSLHFEAEVGSGRKQGYPIGVRSPAGNVRATIRFPLSRMANPRLVRLWVIGICLSLLIGSSSGLFYTSYYLPTQQHVSATATAQVMSTRTARSNATATVTLATATARLAAGQNPYPPYGGTLLLNASLSKNTSSPVWDEVADPAVGGFCAFTGGAYHVGVAKKGKFYYCADDSNTFTNFAYQVQMRLLKGNQAGIFFRLSASGSFYYFLIDAQGNYELDIEKNHNSIGTISSGSSSAIKTGFNQPNPIAVVAQGTGFDLYVNLQHLAHVSDTTFSEGQIGIIAASNGLSTEAVFSNAKVWKL